MSDHCGCIYVGCDDFVPVTHRAKVRARKQHTCDECNVPIAPGQDYERFVGKEDGAGVFVHKTCSDCMSLRNEFFCEGYIFGNIYEDVSYHLIEIGGEVSSACLLRLTPGARVAVIDMIDEVWKDIEEEVDE